MKLKMFRREFEFGCYSDLYIDGELFCVTVEKPWRNNEPYISCVPYGSYKLIPHVSLSKGDCFVLNAPSLGVTPNGPSQRTHCLFHVANKPSQLAGCIAPGRRFGVVDGEWSVVSSESAFCDLIEKLGNETHDLEILKA